MFEYGKMNEADDEKVRLEVKQRKSRKVREDSNVEYKPIFFDKIEEFNPFTKKPEHNYIPKQGQESYWERRKVKDWSGLPDLF